MHEHVHLTQTISNHYNFCHVKCLCIFMDIFWKCQSLTKDVCKEQMPRCKFQFEMSEAVRAFQQKQNICTERMHSEVRRYLQFLMDDLNEDHSHPNYVEMSTHRPLYFIVRTLKIELSAVYMVTTVFDIFFINPNTRPLFTFLPSPHGTRRRIQNWGPTPPAPSRDARPRPCTAEPLQGTKRYSGRIIRRRFSL